MKSSVKREKKKYPYHRMKHSLISQIRAVEKKEQAKLYRYAIVDDKGKVIEKFRYKFTANQMFSEIQKNHYSRLKIVKLDVTN